MSQKKGFSLKVFIKSFRNYRAYYKLHPDFRNIVIYSESGQDWHHFSDIIGKLLDMGNKVTYVTSDLQDQGLSFAHPEFRSIFIGDGFWLITFFQFLKADCLVLTMIDLNIFQLKRSINPVHYIYLFHAMGSTHMVDFESSYDHYDTILCSGQHQIDEIRKRESLKNLPAKNLVPHGYARIENLMKQASVRSHKSVKPYTVLIAPTWGPNSIMNICGKKLVTILLDAGFKVILRPHYQTAKLTPEVIQDILDTCSGNSLFSHVSKMGDTDSLFDSDILICDWSSMSIEYALGLEKPVLYIDVPKRVRNNNYTELGLEPMEISIRNQVGAVLSPDNLSGAPSLINSLCENPEKFKAGIRQFREKVVFNLGNSVAVGAAAIAEIADKVKVKEAM